MLQKIEQKRSEMKSYARQLARKQIDTLLFDELMAGAQRELAEAEAHIFDIEKRLNDYEKDRKDLDGALNRMHEVIRGGQLTRADIAEMVKCIRVRELAERARYNIPMIELTIEWVVDDIFARGMRSQGGG